MTPQEVIPILERLQEPEAWEPQISRDAYEALELAIEALEDRDKQSASSEQVGKDIKFPTIYCCRGYDSIQDENGRMGFGVYDPQEKNIYIAGDVPKEIFLRALFHEIFHWMQDVAEMKFDEDDANSFSDILYDAVDVFDGRGPELFGQKTIVEPGEMFVGDKVLKEALNDQFRDTTKKTDDVSISKQEVLTNIRKLCDGCYLMEHCGQCNPECRLRQAIDMIEESSSVPMIPKKPSENGESEMNSMDEWWKNYIRSRMSQDDVPDIRVGKTDFQPGDKFILELGAERRMFGEFEIAGTDLYVETRLLEKLTRYEPEEKTEKIPYKKPEIIRCKDCQYRDPEDKKCDHGHGIVWQLPRPDDWFCADGKA